jgi:hypothetical protein
LILKKRKKGDEYHLFPRETSNQLSFFFFCESASAV